MTGVTPDINHKQVGDMPTLKQLKQNAERINALREHKKIAKSGHTHRIAEQRIVIKDAKRAIKMHKLLIKQSVTSYKLKRLEQ